MSGLERVPDIFWFNVKAINVIEPTVPGFGDNRQAPPVASLIGWRLFNAPVNNGVACDADAMRVRNNDWSLKKAALFKPRCAGHFTVAI